MTPNVRAPVLRRHLRVHAVDGQGVFLVGEQESHWLEGRLYLLLLPLLDGRGVDELLRGLDGRLSAAEVYYGLHRLASRGWLTESGSDGPEAARWHALGVEPAHAAGRLARERVAVLSLEGGAAEPLVEALRLEGLTLVPSEEASLQLVLVDDYLNESLAGLNREALRSGRPWLVARFRGREAWWGPWFRPGKSACWECLAHRLRLNRPVDVLLRKCSTASFARPGDAGGLNGSRAAAHLLAAAVARGLAGAGERLDSTLVTLDVVGLHAGHHPVSRRPQCPVCGEPERVRALQLTPVQLQPRPKVFTRDGGHRGASPEEVLQRFGRHVDVLTGIVQRLEPFESGAVEGLPVIDAGYNRALPYEDMAGLQESFRARNVGKGSSVSQARASALGEAIERYCGVFQGDEARLRASRVELGPEAVEPCLLLQFSERQYARGTPRERGPAHRALRVPVRFDPAEPIDWTPVWSLTHGVRRYVPSALCFHAYPHAGPAFGWADSNGCAAGSSLEDAILQGFLELVERDAVALWWYNRACRPGVHLSGFDEPGFHLIRERYRELGREVEVLDITTDLGIPAFVAVSYRREGEPEPLLGFGAHLEARLGILRALTEMSQMLACARAGGPEAGLGALGPYLRPSPAALREPQDFARSWSGDLREDVERCVRLAAGRGLEVLVLDQTRPDVEMPVVRVMVPGLRHFWPRLGPGRLYDVPVQLGWQPRALAEDALNPLPILW